MTNFLISFEAAKTDRSPKIADQLRELGAVHLHGCVWLACATCSANHIRELLQAHAGPRDAICVIQLPEHEAQWTTTGVSRQGVDWLRKRYGQPTRLG